MKKYIKPNIFTVAISQKQCLMAGSQNIENGPNVSDTNHGGGAGWARESRFSTWDDDTEE